MDTDLAIKLREDLEKDILLLLKKFEDQVGLKIEMIKVNRAIANLQISGVEVKVDLRR